ncbi:uncharacterized protein LOC115929684 [Strongylocentrotus purpuratus]|uniref:Ig-like domain-containing protein n=1 Tax=Strongylocentrotus purpuratus TaxID=7668 RepID=A0A7M7PRW4_STRPU|nr:uncharacterized protein LOC115929684 [Strongylocentrotus purpuratus]
MGTFLFQCLLVVCVLWSCEALVFTVQPMSMTIPEGTSIILSCEVDQAENVAFSWTSTMSLSRIHLGSSWIPVTVSRSVMYRGRMRGSTDVWWNQALLLKPQCLVIQPTSMSHVSILFTIPILSLNVSFHLHNNNYLQFTYDALSSFHWIQCV